MTLARDLSTPALRNGPSATGATFTTNSFSPPAGSLLLFYYADYVAGSITVASVSDSLGSHLNWTRLVAVSGNGGDEDAELWIADCPSAQTSMTVTATTSGSMVANECSIGVVVLTGALPVASQTGATASVSHFSGSPSQSVTTTADGSLVVGLMSTRITTDPTATIPSGQTDVFGSQALLGAPTTDNFYNWLQSPTADTAASGTNITINNTVSGEYAMVTAEILAGSGGAGPVGTGFFAL